MENDSNNKSQTGGLKLMTVFIAVLALHVVVIGGFTVYHLMSGGTTDVDLTTTDKSHKGADGTSVTESTMPDASQADKTTGSAPTEVASIPANPTTPAPDTAASAAAPIPVTATATTPTPTPGSTVTPTASTTATTTTPAPAVTPEAPAPAPTVASVPAQAPAPALTPTPSLTLTAPSVDMANENSQTPTGPISSTLLPPPDMAPSLNGPLSAGPVHMPAANSSSALAKAERVHQREHEETYTVKITDSYKKIAHAHHVTVAELKDANGIKGNVLHTGQKLVIPSEKKYVAESTSTLDSTPTTSVSSTVAAPMTTGLATTTTTTSPAVASTGLHHHLYTIVKGDTLTKIAHKFKTTPSAIISANDIADPAKLTIGKKLKIPSREARSAQNVAPATVQPSQVQSQPKTTVSDGQLANFVP